MKNLEQLSEYEQRFEELEEIGRVLKNILIFSLFLVTSKWLSGIF